MWDFSIGGSLGLMGRTLPFILLRMAVYFGITLGYILVTGMGAGVGWGVGGFGDAEFRTDLVPPAALGSTDAGYCYEVRPHRMLQRPPYMRQRCAKERVVPDPEVSVGWRVQSPL